VPAAPLVRVVRSGLEESVHLGHVAVCDAEGRLIASAGEPDRLFFIRSCLKPVQASVSLRAIDLAMPDDLVAVMCSSHNGEPVHLDAVRSVLKLGGLGWSALRTPPDRPIDPASAAAVGRPAPRFHNCSGKHAGMLLACVRQGWETETYRSRSHPLQRRVRTAVRRLTGEQPKVGVDGCGLPVHGVSLRAIATMYARLATADDPHVARGIEAMRAVPYMVGGRDRDDTAVMQATPDVVMKEGAEALDCAVSLTAGLGVAVKVADGGSRAAGPAVIAVLDRLGLLDGRARRHLREVASPPVLGGGEPQGRLEPVVKLRTDRRT
jgi:L-asparaginase II